MKWFFQIWWAHLNKILKCATSWHDWIAGIGQWTGLGILQEGLRYTQLAVGEPDYIRCDLNKGNPQTTGCQHSTKDACPLLHLVHPPSSWARRPRSWRTSVSSRFLLQHHLEGTASHVLQGHIWLLFRVTNCPTSSSQRCRHSPSPSSSSKRTARKQWNLHLEDARPQCVWREVWIRDSCSEDGGDQALAGEQPLWPRPCSGGLVQRGLQVTSFLDVSMFIVQNPRILTSAFPYATKYGTPGWNESLQSFPIINSVLLSSKLCPFFQKAHCVRLWQGIKLISCNFSLSTALVLCCSVGQTEDWNATFCLHSDGRSQAKRRCCLQKEFPGFTATNLCRK